MKSAITDITITIHEKYKPSIEIENRCNFIMVSNNLNTINKTYDRRYIEFNPYYEYEHNT